ncbi:MAG: thiamine pyrophosphate-dependent dehydrogenase E1 component subunit alpha [Chloroflexota bacterium]|nr:thiamine pyrophosphate-dependent dehydrogenase E1 component subunit alpha [Chloroflexota bacterium]
MAIEKETLVELYSKMLTIRRFEEKARDLLFAGELPGFVHVYLGEEAVAVGVCSNLRHDDYITSTHRGHGHLVAKGADPKRMMAEIFGRATGYCKGKGGTMHITDFSIGILGANGIVGAGLPIAAGAGLAAKMKGTDQVSVCFFGDGASNQGTFHESVNLSSAWKLPVVYVCENNRYGEFTPYRVATSVEDIADRAAGYAIPGIVVDGQDVVAVYEAAQEAIKRARAGEGPSLVECKTYRFEGHMAGEQALLGERTYRSQDEVEFWMRERDPVANFRKQLLETETVTEAEVKDVEAKVEALIDEAVAFAKESPFPALEEALEDVFYSAA